MTVERRMPTARGVAASTAPSATAPALDLPEGPSTPSDAATPDATSAPSTGTLVTGDPRGDGEVADGYVRTLEELTGLLLEESSLLGLLEQVLELTAEAVASCAAVSVTVVDEQGRYVTAAASSPDARRIDATQYELDEGPCIDSLHTGEVHHLTDVFTEPRWPTFCARARELGYRTVLAVPLTAGNDTIGALNVFAGGPNGLSDEDIALTGRIAAPAATTLANARAYGSVSRLAGQLQAALESRALIEQAKGIVMVRERCSPDQAFELLRQASQTSNRKLRDVAAALVTHVADGRRRPAGQDG
jgi:GAF domain-containing protein